MDEFLKNIFDFDGDGEVDSFEIGLGMGILSDMLDDEDGSDDF